MDWFRKYGEMLLAIVGFVAGAVFCAVGLALSSGVMTFFGMLFLAVGAVCVWHLKKRKQDEEDTDDGSTAARQAQAARRYSKGLVKEKTPASGIAPEKRAAEALADAEQSDDSFRRFVRAVLVETGYLSLGAYPASLMLFGKDREMVLVRVYRGFTGSDIGVLQRLTDLAKQSGASAAFLITNAEADTALIASAADAGVVLMDRPRVLSMAERYFRGGGAWPLPVGAESELPPQQESGAPAAIPPAEEPAESAAATQPPAGDAEPAVYTLTGEGKTLAMSGGVITVTDGRGGEMRIDARDVAEVIYQEPGYVLPGYLRLINTTEAYASGRRFNEDAAQITVTNENKAAAEAVREQIEKHRA